MRLLMQETLGLVAIDAFLDGDELVLGHQLGDRLARVGGEAHVAVGEDADQLAVAAAVAGGLDHGNARNLVAGHELQSIGQRCRWVDGDRIDHHAGLELLHLSHLVGLPLGCRDCGG